VSTTQIPPPRGSQDSGRESVELYDASYWESAYRDIDAPPTLLLQLQDDLDNARRREAFWISVVVHLLVVLAIVNLDKMARFLPRRAAIVRPQGLPQGKDLTFLELPPDAQKITKRPDTNIISDKDRIATSKAPQLDRKELKRILDASRPGRLSSHPRRLRLQPRATLSRRLRLRLPRPIKWRSYRLRSRTSIRSPPKLCLRGPKLRRPRAPRPPVVAVMPEGEGIMV